MTPKTCFPLNSNPFKHIKIFFETNDLSPYNCYLCYSKLEPAMNMVKYKLPGNVKENENEIENDIDTNNNTSAIWFSIY